MTPLVNFDRWSRACIEIGVAPAEAEPAPHPIYAPFERAIRREYWWVPRTRENLAAALRQPGWKSRARPPAGLLVTAASAESDKMRQVRITLTTARAHHPVTSFIRSSDDWMRYPVRFGRNGV